MTINLTAYGIGLGLVIAGWMGGMVVGYVFSLVSNIRHLG